MVLKFGSKGDDVTALQQFLKVKATGVFNKETENAVRIWQGLHALMPDGIVGPKTINAMGFPTTDVSERLYHANYFLDIKRAYLPKGEYFPGPTKKEWLFLHHTAGWHNPYDVVSVWGTDTRGAVATEFLIGGQSVKGNENKYDGTIVQAFPTGGYGWHLGTGNSTMHRNSVGIEICNFGPIMNGKTYVGTPVAQEQMVVLTQPFRGHKTWHAYSLQQITMLKQLILFIAERDGIDPRKGLPQLIRDKGPFAALDTYNVEMVEKTKGLWSHTNVRKDKTDIFPQQEIIDMLLSL